MPVRFALTFERAGNRATPWPSRYVAAYSLRGSIVPFLRDTAGVDGIHGHRYSINVLPESNDRVSVRTEFCVMTDQLERPVADGLATMRASQHTVDIGGVTARLREATIAERVAGTDLLNVRARRQDVLRVSFATVTTFAAGDRRSRAVPDPTLIVKSWASSWNDIQHGPLACPAEIVTELGAMLDPIDGNLTWSVARADRSRPDSAPTPHVPYTLYGFVGHLVLRLHRSATDDAAQWLTRLARIAPYAGTGYHPQLGLGVTRVDDNRAPGSAGSSQSRVTGK